MGAPVGVTTSPILVVDDDRDVREALAEMLEHLGYSTVSAANGKEALTALRAKSVAPWVVLLDLMMPVMDGYGFLAEREGDPVVGAIPVIVLTAGGALDLQRVKSMPHTLRKPIHIPELIATLERVRAG